MNATLNRWVWDLLCFVSLQLMDAVMLQLTRARNRLTTPATMTLPELASSGLMVSLKAQQQALRSN